MTAMKKLTALAALVIALAAAPAWGAGDSGMIKPANVDVSNKASLQRGARNFVNYCMGCHSAQYVRYNRLAEDLGLSEDQLVNNLMFGAEVVHDTMTIAMPAGDAAGWFGQAPPDLTLIARSKGEDYVYSFLKTFYLDDSKPTGVNNAVLSGASMPHVLWELQGTQKAVYEEWTDADGITHEKIAGFEQVTEGSLTPEEYDLFVRDLTAFLSYIAAPERMQRESLGVWVIAFLLVLLLFSYLLKVEYWKDVK